LFDSKALKVKNLQKHGLSEAIWDRHENMIKIKVTSSYNVDKEYRHLLKDSENVRLLGIN